MKEMPTSCGHCRKHGEVTPPLGYAVVDLETTHRLPEQARIVSIAVVLYDPAGVELSRHHTLVNPEVHIPEEASSVNGITDDMVAGAPFFRQLARSVKARLGDNVFCAHNADYDLQILQNEMNSAALSYEPAGVVCTMKLSRFLDHSFNEYTLSACCERLGLSAGSHEALADALACGALLTSALSAGWAPETLEYGDNAFKRLQAVNDHRPASEGQIRRVWGLAKDHPELKNDKGKVDSEKLLALVEATVATRDVDHLTRAQVQRVYDELE